MQFFSYISTYFKTIFLVFILLAAVSSVSSAQNIGFECTGQKELNKSLLGNVQLAYSSVNSMSANFIQSSYLAALEQSEDSSGKVTFIKPGKMLWEYITPNEQTFLVKDKTVWFYQKNENQLMIDDFSKVILSEAPVSFLLGIGEIEKSFDLISNCNTQLGVLLELKDNTKNNSKVGRFRLLVDGKTFNPKGAQVEDVGGNTTTILFEKIQINHTVKEQLFEPVFPKGVDTVDKRGVNYE